MTEDRRTAHGVLLKLSAASAAAAFAALIQLSPTPIAQPLAPVQAFAAGCFSVGLPLSLASYVIALMVSGDLLTKHLRRTQRPIAKVLDLAALLGGFATMLGAAALSVHLLAPGQRISAFIWPLWPYWAALVFLGAVIVWTEWSAKREARARKPA